MLFTKHYFRVILHRLLGKIIHMSDKLKRKEKKLEKAKRKKVGVQGVQSDFQER